jgi:hypothetical protein
MQLAYRHDERPGESYKALKKLQTMPRPLRRSRQVKEDPTSYARKKEVSTSQEGACWKSVQQLKQEGAWHKERQGKGGEEEIRIHREVTGDTHGRQASRVKQTFDKKGMIKLTMWRLAEGI